MTSATSSLVWHEGMCEVNMRSLAPAHQEVRETNRTNQVRSICFAFKKRRRLSTYYIV